MLIDLIHRKTSKRPVIAQIANLLLTVVSGQSGGLFDRIANQPHVRLSAAQRTWPPLYSARQLQHRLSPIPLQSSLRSQTSTRTRKRCLLSGTTASPLAQALDCVDRRSASETANITTKVFDWQPSEVEMIVKANKNQSC